MQYLAGADVDRATWSAPRGTFNNTKTGDHHQ